MRLTEHTRLGVCCINGVDGTLAEGSHDVIHLKIVPYVSEIPSYITF